MPPKSRYTLWLIGLIGVLAGKVMGFVPNAALHLLGELGAVVLRALFVIELASLGGREALAPADVRSLVCYGS